MKKKLLTAFLVTALGISMLSGCGGKNSDDNSTKSEQSTKEKDQEAADKVAMIFMYRRGQTRQMSSAKLQRRRGMH